MTVEFGAVSAASRIFEFNDFALVKNDRLEISRRQRTAFLTAVASYMGGVL